MVFCFFSQWGLKQATLGGRVSDKEETMHSKALKTNKKHKTTNKQNLNNEKLLFAVPVRSPHPFPMQVAILCSCYSRPQEKRRPRSHVARLGTSHTLTNRCAMHRWGWGWGWPQRDVPQRRLGAKSHHNEPLNGQMAQSFDAEIPF